MAVSSSLLHYVSYVSGIEKSTAATIAGAALFFFIFEYVASYFFRPPLAKYLSRQFGKPLQDVDKVLKSFCYGGQASSMAHVVVQLPVTLMVLTDSTLSDDTLYAQSNLALWLASVSTGYFVYDLVICITRFETQGVPFLLHAICSLLVFAYGTLTHQALYYAGAFLVWEFSTPFVIVRHLLFKIKAGDTRAYLNNALLMMLTFFLSRNVWGVYASFVFWHASEQELRNPRPGGFAPVMIYLFRAANLALNGLNVLWFSKMVRKALELLLAGGSKAGGEAADGSLTAQGATALSGSSGNGVEKKSQ